MRVGGDNRSRFWFPESLSASLIPPWTVRPRMPKDGDATVAPNQPWTEDGTALVAPMPPFPDPEPRTMPLDNRTAGNDTIKRLDYPLGLVIVQEGHEPAATPATLPIMTSTANSAAITDEMFVDWPDGFVIWFITH